MCSSHLQEYCYYYYYYSYFFLAHTDRDFLQELSKPRGELLLRLIALSDKLNDSENCPLELALHGDLELRRQLHSAKKPKSEDYEASCTIQIVLSCLYLPFILQLLLFLNLAMTVISKSMGSFHCWVSFSFMIFHTHSLELWALISLMSISLLYSQTYRSWHISQLFAFLNMEKYILSLALSNPNNQITKLIDWVTY